MKAHPLLLCLYGINKKYNKSYCYPSQAKILQNITLYQNLRSSIPSLNRWLRVIEDAGYIQRVRRIKRDPRKGMVFKSTLYHITGLGYQLLYSNGVNCYKELREWLNRAKERASWILKNLHGAQHISTITYALGLTKARPDPGVKKKRPTVTKK